jgi:quinol monooxygenase YgiN
MVLTMTMHIPRSNVVITVRMKVKPAFVNKMRVMAHDLMTASRTEDGCILYIMTESQGDESLFSLFMVWRDEEAYKRHSASPYMRAFDNEISHEILEKRHTVEKWHSLG